MPKAYSKDLRIRVTEQAERGMNIKEICKTFDLSKTVVYKWMQVKRETGRVEPIEQRRPGNDHKVLKEEYAEFEDFLNKNRGKNAIELSKLWKRPMSPSAMKNYIKKVGFTLKKNNSAMQNGMKKGGEYFKNSLQL